MLARVLFRHRDALATLPAAAVLAMLLGVSVRQAVRIHEDEPPMLVSLAPAPVPEPAPPARAVPTPPAPPVPRPVHRPPLEPLPRVIGPAPAPVMAPPPTLTPAPVVASAPPPPIAPLTPPAPVAPPRPPAPSPAQVSATLEATYIARLRAYLDSIKRYPTTREARSLRPQGHVRLWLELARDGSLRDAGVEETSGSMILDSAALATVRQGTYPAFPADMWPGAERHRFGVTLEYTLQG